MNVRIDYAKESNKIKLIIFLREITGQGLKDAKDFVEDKIPFFRAPSVGACLGTSGTCHAGSLVVTSERSALEIEQRTSERAYAGISYSIMTPKSGVKGNHVFSLPDCKNSRDMVEAMRGGLNTARFKLKAQTRDGWICVKIHKKGK
jgi:hypothetical protein